MTTELVTTPTKNPWPSLLETASRAGSLDLTVYVSNEDFGLLMDPNCIDETFGSRTESLYRDNDKIEFELFYKESPDQRKNVTVVCVRTGCMYIQ